MRDIVIIGDGNSKKKLAKTPVMSDTKELKDAIIEFEPYYLAKRI